MPDLLLASSSPYRRTLLERLGLPFICAAPDIDETPAANESPEQLTQRLALDKARALAERYPQHAAAVAQLQRCSGRTVRFTTALCLLNSATDRYQLISEPFDVSFRELSDETIERYLQQEQPYDCAGSFRMEGLGISLFRSLRGDDPNSLIGLPLIRLCEMLPDPGPLPKHWTDHPPAPAPPPAHRTRPDH